MSSCGDRQCGDRPRRRIADPIALPRQPGIELRTERGAHGFAPMRRFESRAVSHYDVGEREKIKPAPPCLQQHESVGTDDQADRAGAAELRAQALAGCRSCSLARDAAVRGRPLQGPGCPPLAARSMSSRCSALAPGGGRCGGAADTIRRTWSSAKASNASWARRKWARWTGSKVPPSTPIAPVSATGGYSITRRISDSTPFRYVMKRAPCAPSITR